MDFSLELFVTVVKEQSFSRAAKKLHISQPAVSMQIKALEEKYGVPLFERSNRLIRLTKAGNILYLHAEKILHNYSKVDQLIGDIYHSAKGILSIGSGYTFGEYILPQALATFKQKYPEIVPKVTIKNSNRIFKEVVRNEIDIGIIEGELSHPSAQLNNFFTDEMVIIVPMKDTLQHKRVVEVNELQDRTWILRESDSSTRDFVSQEFSRLGIIPKYIIELGSSQTIKGAVEAGLGISMISTKTLDKELELNRLRSLKIKDESMKRNFYYVINKSQLTTKATELFIELLKGLDK